MVLKLPASAAKRIAYSDVAIFMSRTTLVFVADHQSIARDRDSNHNFVAPAFVVMLMRRFDRHLAVGDSLVITTQCFNVVLDVSHQGSGPINVVKVNA